MILNSPYITGSITVTGNANVQGTLTVTGSLSGTATSASYAYTASSAINATSASYAYTASSAINAFSASKAISSSYADTASYANNLTVMGNLTVFGTQSVQYITSSQLNVANNIINVNVGTPGVRFGGLSVYDSGSQAGATGSLFWDSQNNNWVYQQVTGSTYTGGMLISGPRNTGGLGNEAGTTNNAVMKGMGGDHITSSAIFEVSGSVTMGLLSTNSHSITGSINITGSVTANQINLPGGVYQNQLQNTNNNDFILSNSGNFRIVNNTNTSASFTVVNKGNVGIGISSPTVSTNWNDSSINALNIRNASIYGYSNYELGIQTNAYYDGAWKHIETGVRPWQIQLGNDTAMKFSTAASGSAGGVLSWIELMRISPAGNIGVSQNNPTALTGFTSICVNNATNGGFFEAQQNGTVLTRFGGQSDVAFIDTVANIPFILKTNSIERFRISSTGLVGIGTNNPTSPLTIKAASRGDTLRLSISGSSSVGDAVGITFGSATYDKAQIIAYNENAGNAAGYLTLWTGGTPATTDMTERMRITSTGYVGIGMTVPPNKLSISQDITNDGDILNGQMALCGSTAIGKRMVLGYDTNSDGYGYIKAGYLGNVWTYLALQPIAGSVVIGQTTNPGYKLSVNGQPGANGYTAFANYSDSRLKENITNLEATNILDKISQIRPVTFNYNELSGHDEATRARRISGFIAQELMEVFPEMVGTIKVKDNEYYDTNLSNLNLYLVKAIQELKAINDDLQAQINELKER